MPLRSARSALLACCTVLACLAACAQAVEPAPAQVDGLWCGTGPLHDFSLRLRQQQQQVEGELVRRGRARTIEGRLEGNVLRTQSTRVGALVLELDGEKLRISDGEGALALVRGQSFTRSEAPTCPE